MFAIRLNEPIINSSPVEKTARIGYNSVGFFDG
jgi:hypothetical protein